MTNVIKIILYILLAAILLNTSHAGMVQPSSAEILLAKTALESDKTTIGFVSKIDKIVETYSSNQRILFKLSRNILKAKSKLTSSKIKTKKQRNILTILHYLDMKVSLALYKMYKLKQK